MLFLLVLFVGNSHAVELTFEKVFKVEIPLAVYEQMNGDQVWSSLENYRNYKWNHLNIDEAAILKTETIQYRNDSKERIMHIEIIVTSSKSDTIKAADKLKDDFELFVNNTMLNEFLAFQKSVKVIKSVQLDDVIVNNLSNDEIQELLNVYFDGSKAFARSDIDKYRDKLTVKIVAHNKTMKIWLIELIAHLPENEGDRVLNPLQKDLKKFVSTKMVQAAMNKITEHDNTPNTYEPFSSQ